MSTATRRILRAAVVLALLLAGLIGLTNAPRPNDPVSPPGGKSPVGEAVRFTDAQRATADFLDNARAAAGTGRGLFETDFFKPPPAPPPKPKPMPPTTRELVLFYRGLAAFPDGGRVAYLSIEGRTVTLAAGEAVSDGWQLASFNAEQATLAKDGQTLILPFNRRVTVSVPVKP